MTKKVSPKRCRVHCKTNGNLIFLPLCNGTRHASKQECVAAQALLTQAGLVLPESKALAKKVFNQSRPLT